MNVGDGTLLPAVPYEVGSEVADLAAADLDGDGDADLVAAPKGDYVDGRDIDLLLSDGTGRFTRTALEVGNQPKYLALADLDGHEDVDVVMATYSGDSFTRWSDPLSRDARGLAAGDLTATATRTSPGW